MPAVKASIPLSRACELLGESRKVVMSKIARGIYPRPSRSGRDYLITTDWISRALDVKEAEKLQEAELAKLTDRAQQIRG